MDLVTGRYRPQYNGVDSGVTGPVTSRRLDSRFRVTRGDGSHDGLERTRRAVRRSTYEVLRLPTC